MPNNSSRHREKVVGTSGVWAARECGDSRGQRTAHPRSGVRRCEPRLAEHPRACQARRGACKGSGGPEGPPLQIDTNHAVANDEAGLKTAATNEQIRDREYRSW